MLLPQRLRLRRRLIAFVLFSLLCWFRANLRSRLKLSAPLPLRIRPYVWHRSPAGC